MHTGTVKETQTTRVTASCHIQVPIATLLIERVCLRMPNEKYIYLRFAFTLAFSPFPQQFFFSTVLFLLKNCANRGVIDVCFILSSNFLLADF